MTYVHLERVLKRYDGERVVDVDGLRFRRGERVRLTGGNGSGKSTLLRILAGITRPTSGAVRWAGGRAPVIGYLPQSRGFFPDASLRDNLRIRCAMAGVPTAPEHLLPDLGFEGALGRRPVGELSGAYQRLASFALAMAVAPECLLLDEPFAGLDEANARAMARLLDRSLPGLDLLVLCEPVPSGRVATSRIVEMRAGRHA